MSRSAKSTIRISLTGIEDQHFSRYAHRSDLQHRCVYVEITATDRVEFGPLLCRRLRRKQRRLVIIEQM